MKSPSMNYWFLHQICGLAQSGAMAKSLSTLGLSRECIQSLITMTPGELDKFCKECDDQFISVDSAKLIKQLALARIPAHVIPYVKWGASNAVLMKFFRVDARVAADWRDTIEPAAGISFRQRAVPLKKFETIWKELEALEKPLQPDLEELLKLAQKYTVSIGAIWTLVVGNEKEDKDGK